MKKSIVSFVFDGEHNKPYVVAILNKNLTGMKHKFEKVSFNSFRIFVRSDDDEGKIFDECKKIQCFCVFDYSQQI